MPKAEPQLKAFGEPIGDAVGGGALAAWAMFAARVILSEVRPWRRGRLAGRGRPDAESSLSGSDLNRQAL